MVLAMRRLWLALAFFLVAAVSSCTTWFIVGVGRSFENPRGALVRDIGGGEWADLDRRFGERVRQRFPLGSLQEPFINELNSEGFRPMWPNEVGENEEGARLNWTALPCAMSATVRWQADPQGRITALATHYGEAGCL
jgi:hypothetical protein